MKRSDRLLLLSDDTDFVNRMKACLAGGGFEIHASADGDETKKPQLFSRYALIMIDCPRSYDYTLKICRRCWASCHDTPIIIFSERKVEQDCVRCLELGCDDYILKSSSPREVSARIKTVLRRCSYAQPGSKSKIAKRPIKVNGLAIDPERRRTVIKGRRVDLTAKEYEILYLFASNPGKVYSKRQILDIVWDYHDDVYEHTVNSHINRLRKKIEKIPHSPQLILTVWGTGYRFADPGMDR